MLILPFQVSNQTIFLYFTVAFARLLFPTEARLAMEMADAHSTFMYNPSGLSASRGSSGNLREVDLNETPSVRTRRLQVRLQALIKTGIVNRFTNLNLLEE